MKRGSGCCAVDIYWTAASTSFSDGISYIKYLFSEWRIYSGNITSVTKLQWLTSPGDSEVGSNFDLLLKGEINILNMVCFPLFGAISDNKTLVTIFIKFLENVWKCMISFSIIYNNLFEVSYLVGSTEAPSKVFLLFFLLPDWLKFNHLKSRMECGFSDIFSRHICSTVEETMGVTNNPASFGGKMFRKPHLKLLR